MKILVESIVLALVVLVVMRIVGYFRFIRMHKREIAELTALIGELKRKQQLLTQRENILIQSQEYHQTKLMSIQIKIQELINRFLL